MISRQLLAALDVQLADAADEGRALLDRGRLRPRAVGLVGCGDRGLELGVGDGVVGLDRLAGGGVGHGIAHRVGLLLGAPRQSRSAAVQPAGRRAGGLEADSTRGFARAEAPIRGAGHHEEQVGQAVQVGQHVRVGQLARLGQCDGPALGPPHHAAGQVQRGAGHRLAGQHELGRHLLGRLQGVDLRLQRADHLGGHQGRARGQPVAPIGVGGQLGPDHEQLALQAHDQRVQPRLGPIGDGADGGARQPQRGDHLVGAAIRIGPQVRLADPIAADTAGRWCRRRPCGCRCASRGWYAAAGTTD